MQGNAHRIGHYNRAIRILSLCRERNGEIITRYTHGLHVTKDIRRRGDSSKAVCGNSYVESYQLDVINF